MRIRRVSRNGRRVATIDYLRGAKAYRVSLTKRFKLTQTTVTTFATSKRTASSIVSAWVRK